MNHRRRLRLLLVEDDDGARRTIARLLAGIAEVAEAASCADAVRQLDTGRFDAVVADERLPDGRGSVLLAHVRERRPIARCILISGEDAPTDRRRTWHTFLRKPLAYGTLLLALVEPHPDANAR